MAQCPHCVVHAHMEKAGVQETLAAKCGKHRGKREPNCSTGGGRAGGVGSE